MRKNKWECMGFLCLAIVLLESVGCGSQNNLGDKQQDVNNEVGILSENNEEEVNEIQDITSKEAFLIEEQIDGGFRWSIDTDGVLTIEADGDYAGDYNGYPKWLEYASEIRSAVILSAKNVTNTSLLFFKCINLTSVELGGLDTSNVTDMNEMFFGCESLTSLDLSNFNTSNVTDMRGMFHSCKSLTDLDLSSFDTSNVQDMRYMFVSCQSLNSLNLSSFNTSNVTNMSEMFHGCYITSLNLGSFDTSNVIDMDEMFDACKSLTSLDLSNFNTSNVTNMCEMFRGCESLTDLDLSSFDTSNVKDMRYMFKDCSSLMNLDLESFNTSKVAKMTEIFRGCASLTSLDLSSFDTSGTVFGNMQNMFTDCSSLKELIIPSGFSCKSNLPNNGFAWKNESGERCTTVEPNLSYPMAYVSSDSFTD